MIRRGTRTFLPIGLVALTTRGKSRSTARTARPQPRQSEGTSPTRRMGEECAATMDQNRTGKRLPNAVFLPPRFDDCAGLCAATRMPSGLVRGRPNGLPLAELEFGSLRAPPPAGALRHFLRRRARLLPALTRATNAA